MISTENRRALLQTAQTIAVVGLSESPNRDSHGVARYLQRSGYRIIPVNPLLRGELLGEPVYATLADVPVPIDIVDVFRRAEFVPQIVAEALALATRPRALWLQLSVIHQLAADQAAAAGMQVVMDRCIAVEHRRLCA